MKGEDLRMKQKFRRIIKKAFRNRNTKVVTAKTKKSDKNLTPLVG